MRRTKKSRFETAKFDDVRSSMRKRLARRMLRRRQLLLGRWLWWTEQREEGRRPRQRRRRGADDQANSDFDRKNQDSRNLKKSRAKCLGEIETTKAATAAQAASRLELSRLSHHNYVARGVNDGCLENEDCRHRLRLSKQQRKSRLCNC